MSLDFFKMIHLNYQIKSNEGKIKRIKTLPDCEENFKAIAALESDIAKRKELIAKLEKPYNN